MKTSVLLFSFLLGSLVSLALAQCSGFGQMINGYCSCDSGYAPSSSAQNDCNVAASGGCAAVTTSPLETAVSEQVTFDSVRFFSDALIVELSAPLVINRTQAWIEFLDSTDPACAYPGPNWQKTISNCRDTYTLTLPWALHQTCQFNKFESADFVEYNSSVVVTNAQQVGYLLDAAVDRNISSQINVGVNFAKRIDLATDVLVFSSVGVEAALTEQRYDHDTSLGVLTFQTVAQWPYKLEDNPMVTLPAGFPAQVPTITKTSEDCSPLGPNFCTQFWHLTFQPTNCLLTGQYRLSFTVGCSNETVCPIDADSNSTIILANVVSENFCDVFTSDVTFSGTLTSYNDNTYTTTRQYFIQNSTAYFEAEVSSPNATIVSTNITDIVIVDGASNQFIYTSNAPFGAGVAASIVQQGGVMTATVQFRLLSTFIDIPDIWSKTFTIRATVKVGYLNALNKRDVEVVTRTLSTGTGLGKTRVLSTIEVGVTDTAVVPSSTGGSDGDNTVSEKTATTSSLFVGLVVACVALAVVVIGGLLVIKKKTSGYVRTTL